jgi:glycosyltransferase involved in cell wall biosynthesis
MVERKRVGLVYSYNEKWVAGSYYILNIIHALNKIGDQKKPEIILLTDSKETFEKIKLETQYPYLQFYKFPFIAKYNLLEKVLNKMSRVTFGTQLINKKPKFPKLEFLYPNEIQGFPDYVKKINWIPDFQEDYLPQFFSEEEVNRRKEYQKNILVKSDVVVFSSRDAKNDFERLYPKSKTKLFVLPFAVTHPDFSNEKIDDLLIKYNLPKIYFLVPNQFWVHKNHIIILKAVKNLIEKGIDIKVAFTGKNHDFRNIDYFKYLQNYIKDNKLQDNIFLLGFIDRKEQLCLMKNANAVIQPSLFEGWSTVVEDAKALNKFLILSDIPVHREQIKQNVCFFNTKDELELSNILAANFKSPAKTKRIRYNESIKIFGLKLVELFNNNT